MRKSNILSFVFIFYFILYFPQDSCADTSTAPSLTFTKQVTSLGTITLGTITSGATLTYTLSYENKGLGTATNVVITDVIPTETIYITDSASGDNTNITYSHDGGINYDESQNVPVTHIKWTLINDIPPGDSGEVSFNVRIGK